MHLPAKSVANRCEQSTKFKVNVWNMPNSIKAALTGSESVWLKDVTDRFQTQKRVFGDPDLPDELTFQIKRGSGALTLTLKRNYEIDPNADIYFVERTNDGRSIKSKSITLEREALAYYQDMDNGAYMTVRCIKSLNQQCDRVISGRIQIGEKSYDLRPAETDATQGKVMEDMDVFGRRYLLLDQTHILQENVVVNKDSKDLKELFHWYNPDEKQNNFDIPEDTLSSRNPADLQDRGATDKIRQGKQNYYVKVALCMDSGIWDLYYAKVTDTDPSIKTYKAKRWIRAAYSHIMNGVNLRFKSIEDPSISISVILTEFIFFLPGAEFPHKTSTVLSDNGTKYIEGQQYLDDFMDWDKTTRANNVQKFDHAMLFTTYRLYKDSISSNFLYRCMISFKGVCDLGKRSSVILARDYVWTVQTAAYALGYNLGAHLDGESGAAWCKAEDNFVMSPIVPQLSSDRISIANMWTFSDCSVESFKKTLQNKECVKTTGSLYNVTEYTKFMTKPASYIFTPQEQCSLIYGQGSKYYGYEAEELCYRLKCTHPSTGKGRNLYLNAAEGTKCGNDKWCIEGWCVPRSSR